MTREEAKRILYVYRAVNLVDASHREAFDMAIKALEQEPCDNVCEWFEQYVDIATDIVELRFSDGTVKKAKRGLYLRDIEKSIRKMMIDQIANEKKQESKWIPVSERVPEDGEEVLCFLGSEEMAVLFLRNDWGQNEWVDGRFATGSYDVVAWMPLPKPYKTESEVDS